MCNCYLGEFTFRFAQSQVIYVLLDEQTLCANFDCVLYLLAVCIFLVAVCIFVIVFVAYEVRHFVVGASLLVWERSGK